MIFLGDSFKYLNNLQHFTLNLSDNKLRRENDCLKYLCDSIKQVPKNLQLFELNLKKNKLELDKVLKFNDDLLHTCDIAK